MPAPSTSSGATERLAAHLHAIRFGDIPPDVRDLAAHCMLDLVGLMIVSAHEPLIGILREDALERGGRGEASVVGCLSRLPASEAAAVNAAAGHVLAYDDVNMAIPGHGTAVAFPAALAVAEHRQASGRDLLEAYVAGFEAVGAVAAMVGPRHYEHGFHASATLGVFGAAAAAGRARGLDETQFRQAISIAGSMGAGVKGVFGTMLKPFQVARAAGNGVLAAGLAARGLAGRGDILETQQGVVALMSDDGKPDLLLPPDGFFLRTTLFKYHAACYLAHSAIECGRELRERLRLRPKEIDRVEIAAHPMAGRTCNIQEPGTGPEIGYSVRTLTAMALLGHEVTRPGSLDPALLADRELMALRDRIGVSLVDGRSETECRVTLVDGGGVRHEAVQDVGLPVLDRGAQAERLRAKFATLVEHLLGRARTAQAIEQIADLARLPDVAPITALIRDAGRGGASVLPRASAA